MSKKILHAGNPCVICGWKADGPGQYICVGNPLEWQQWLTISWDYSKEFQHCVPVAARIWVDLTKGLRRSPRIS